MIRVLVAVSPKMYRQTITLFLRSRRPDVKVRSADPLDLQRECALFEPHLLVCHDGTPEDARNRALFLVEIHYSNSLDAVVKANGKDLRIVEDIEIDDLLAVVEEIEKTVSNE
ncbi:MAG: hypothetical protein JOZ19_07165 [Rubrobacter sp.]|nr:hypothetical protein [Rubrobacter sp.]